MNTSNILMLVHIDILEVDLNLLITLKVLLDESSVTKASEKPNWSKHCAPVPLQVSLRNLISSQTQDS